MVSLYTWIKLYLSYSMTDTLFFCCVGESVSKSQGASTVGLGASPSQTSITVGKYNSLISSYHRIQ